MTDKDIDKKLKKMEEQLDIITSSLASRTPDSSFSNQDPRFPPPERSDPRYPSAYGRADEIDLRELFSILWRGKWWIIGITFLFAVAGVSYALSLPNMYKSEGVYALAQKEGSGGGMAGQLGGLASLAGVSLGGGESNDIDQAMALIVSWPFLEEIVEQNKLAPYILAVKGWDRSSGDFIWNSEIYDVASERWKIIGAGNPTSYEVFRALSEFITVSTNAKTGMVTVSVTHYSPVIAEAWVRLLVVTINSHFQRRDIVDAKLNIDYLSNKIDETGIAGMQTVFYGMIESQMKALMLAEVGDEYLLRVVVPPKIAEQKVKPSRAFICIVFFFSGVVLSGLFVLVRGTIKTLGVEK